jgi:dimeric dUTPase (all-alpha-NTP-PPase superfamily)
MTKVFETQKALRDRIAYNEPDRFNKLVLALLVELGECANEWRGFKFWSKDQTPRTYLLHKDTHGQCAPIEKNPLLEEYVDCLHFILEIGLELGAEKWLFKYVGITLTNKSNTITNYFLEVQYRFLELNLEIKLMELEPREIRYLYSLGFDYFNQLGQMLGFTWEQIEQAYYAKNAVNHQRQDENY